MVPAPADQAQRTNVMRLALAAMGGFAGGMASTFVMRRGEDVGEERMKNLVKGSAIGGAAALALFLLFSGVEGVATASTRQPAQPRPAQPITGGLLR
jgi:hypothetical protein